ncbi:DUF3168 domain-containing protein [Novosphingobium sp. BW1]|uniref:DUF3168 domain-containing protein n=1 Tax=Novosphingobium sp. BW1 TaxID=2592621 RepID=UPI0011DE5D7D|nr:DUF3168 domain-containing protein [Novosphingobium sp. BW1]TYC85455.1 DUF3168 domain-containing protein [Novosphingobium sp. BW1]
MEEMLLRAALLTWLQGDPALSGSLNAICEEAPSRASLPWLAIATSASTDWSSKTHRGREVRVALELQGRGDVPASMAALVANIEARIENLPAAHEGIEIVTSRFLRARSEQRPGNRRAVLLEYAFRLIAS